MTTKEISKELASYGLRLCADQDKYTRVQLIDKMFRYADDMLSERLNDPCNDACNDAVDAQGWISVKEGLPNNYDSCIVVSTQNGYRSIYKAYFYINEWFASYTSTTTVITEVTHWMLLPELPKIK